MSCDLFLHFIVDSMGERTRHVLYIADSMREHTCYVLYSRQHEGTYLSCTL